MSDALLQALTARRFGNGPSLDERMADYGFDPDAPRLAMLPNPNGSADPRDWTAPQWLYDMVKAFSLPGHVAQGGSWTPNDVTDMAVNVGLLGAPTGVAAAPRGALAMGGAIGGARSPRLPADFVTNSAGDSYILGRIPAAATPTGIETPVRMFEGLGAGDRLSLGDGVRHDIGRAHLTDHYGDPGRLENLKKGGAPDEVAYVENVIGDPDQLWRERDGSLMAVKNREKDQEIATVALMPSENGDWYSVGTAMDREARKKYPQAAGRELVWSKETHSVEPAPPSSPGERATAFGGSAPDAANLYPRAEGSKVFSMYQDYAPQYRSAIEADLPMDEASRLARARDLGFGPDILYAGGPPDIGEFRVGSTPLTRQPPTDLGAGSAVYPVMARRDGGIETADGLVVTDPTAIRSRFAAFDPAKRDSADILASNAGGGLAIPIAGNDDGQRPPVSIRDLLEFWAKGGA